MSPSSTGRARVTRRALSTPTPDLLPRAGRGTRPRSSSCRRLYEGRWEPHEPVVAARPCTASVAPGGSSSAPPVCTTGSGRLLAIESISRDVTERRAEQQTQLRPPWPCHPACSTSGAPSTSTRPSPPTILAAAVEAVCTHLGWPVGHAFMLDADPGYVVSAAWHEAEPSASRPSVTTPSRLRCSIDSDLAGEAVILVEQVVHRAPRQPRHRTVLGPPASGLRFAITVPVTIEGGIGALPRVLHRRPAAAQSWPSLPAWRISLTRWVELSSAAAPRSTSASSIRPARSSWPARRTSSADPSVRSRSMASALARQARKSEQPDGGRARLAVRAGRADPDDGHATARALPARGRARRSPDRVATGRHRRCGRPSPLSPRPTCVRTDLDVAPSLEVLADAGLLDSILSNLLANAVRFARSAVLVEATALDDEVSLVVSDDGPGVPPELQALLFEPMKGALATSDHGGLGLALVAHAATAHGRMRALRARRPCRRSLHRHAPGRPGPAPSSLSEA